MSLVHRGIVAVHRHAGCGIPERVHDLPGIRRKCLFARLRSAGVTGKATGCRYHIGMRVECLEVMLGRQPGREVCSVPTTWPECCYQPAYVIPVREDDLLLEFNANDELVCVRKGLAYVLVPIVP